MLANDHPGCCGVAARLPKSPGTQKLTPPSSAMAAFGTAPTAISASTALQKYTVRYVRAAGITVRLHPLRVVPRFISPPYLLPPCLSAFPFAVFARLPHEAQGIRMLGRRQ